MKQAAVLYVRVSSDDQLRGVSLDDQEAAGREWCSRRDVDLVAVFREEAKSARATARRVELQKAIELVASRAGGRKAIRIFLVYDLSRGFRNLYDQMTHGRELAKLGARLTSVTLEVTDDASGRAVTGILGVANQFQSELQGEKIRRCMLESTRRGRWCHRAPIGYLNRRGADNRPSIEVDQERAPLVRLAFERVAAGDRLTDALDQVTGLGLRTWVGRKIRMQHFRLILANPFYYGRIRSSSWGVDQEGDHHPLVTEKTWLDVQARMSGRVGPVSPRGRTVDHPDFPLRGWVRSDICQRPLTASSSRSKTGAHHPYYHCWVRGCRCLTVPARKLEDSFLRELQRVQMSEGMARLAEACLLEAWAQRSADSAKTEALGVRRVKTLRDRREQLIDAYVHERAIDRETYDARLAKIDEAIAVAHFELQIAEHPEGRLEELLRTARPMLTDACEVWRSSEVKGKRELQSLVFPAGGYFDGKALRTPETAFVLRAGNDGGISLVAHTGFEPVLPP